MDPNELLIFKEREGRESVKPARKARKPKLDVIEELKLKIQEHERQARVDKAIKEAAAATMKEERREEKRVRETERLAALEAKEKGKEEEKEKEKAAKAVGKASQPKTKPVAIKEKPSRPMPDLVEELRKRVKSYDEQAGMEKAIKEAASHAVNQERITESAVQEKEAVPPAKAEKAPVRLQAREGAFVAKGKRRTRKQILEMQEAGNLTCVWHPWRKAYAICDYCHRGFCFEDIVEENGSYYCLEDVDTAAHETIVKLSYKTMNVGIAASLVAFLPLLIFLYSYIPGLSESLSYVSSIGLLQFIHSATYAYIFPMIGVVLVLLGFIAGVSSLLGSKRAAPMILASSFIAILFLYGYVQSYSVYDLAIGMSSLASLVLFSYGKTIYMPETSVTKKPETLTETWANVSRF